MTEYPFGARMRLPQLAHETSVLPDSLERCWTRRGVGGSFLQVASLVTRRAVPDRQRDPEQQRVMTTNVQSPYHFVDHEMLIP